LQLTNLIGGAEFDRHRGPLVPDENEAVLGLDDQVYPDAVDLVWNMCSFALLYNPNSFIGQHDLGVLKEANEARRWII